MKIGSLFSGGGLGDFGFMAAGMEIAWQCEIDPYCQKVLALRYPDSKKYTDIKTLKGVDLESIDVLTGGFPCQPFSVAGKQKGKEDDRYLWPEMLRIIKELRPRWIVGENVPGIINLALDIVCASLETEGYEVWPVVFPSHALGAWHKRDRLWIICHAKHDGPVTGKDTGSAQTGSGSSTSGQKQACQSSGSSQQHAPMANTGAKRLQGAEFSRDNEEKISRRPKGATGSTSQCRSNAWREYWQFEPSVGRVANGIANRIHRLKMLGNGQVPACTYVIGKMIMEIENG